MRSHRYVRAPAVAAALLATVMLLLASPAISPAAVPPQGLAVWSGLPSGLHLVPGADWYIGACKGPSGSVWAVGAETGIDPPVAVVVSRVRLADGAELGGWSYPAAGAGVRPRAVASDTRRNLYVTCARDGGAWLTIKFSPRGKLLWKRACHAGVGSDTPEDIALDGAGNVVVCGTVSATNGHSDGMVVKYSPAGVLRWKRVVRTSGRDLLSAVAFDGADNVYVSGSKGDSGATPGMGIVRSFTPGGHLRWEHAVGMIGKSTQFQELKVRGTTVTVAGSAGNAPHSRILVARYRTNATGSVIWGPGPIPGYPNGSSVGGLAVDRSGNAVVTGQAFNFGSPAVNTPLVCKIKASSGATLWRQEFSNPAWPHDGLFESVAVDSRGRIYAGGGVTVSGITGNCLLVRYSPGGTPQGMWRADGPGSGECTFDQVLVLNDTQVLAGGFVTGSGFLAGIYRADTTIF
jgi:hypothetical protein